MKDTVLIIGDSPFLGVLEEQIEYLLDKYPSIGINNIITKYKISTHIFQDDKFIFLSNMYSEVKRVTLYSYGDLVLPEKELFNSYTYNFKKNTPDEILLNGNLAWCGFTHDYAISYAITKGYKNIVLVGAADFTQGKHYATDEEFKYSEKLKKASKQFIENITSKRALVTTLNPNSILEIPRVSVEDLLKFDKHE